MRNLLLLGLLTLLACGEQAPPPQPAPKPSPSSELDGLDQVDTTQLRRNADDGDAGAQERLGKMLITGDGVEKDIAGGLKWLRKSAAQGTPSALKTLAEFLDETKDPEAGKWYLAAANKDLPWAIAWVDAAAEAGDLNMMDGLGRIKLRAAETLDEGLALLRKAADGGNARAQLALAEHELAKLKPDYAEARKRLEPAAKAGEVGAMAALAEILEHGQGGPQDHTRGASLYRRAAEGGNVESMVGIARMLQDGKGVAADPSKAVGWLEKAADKGSAAALRELARAHVLGKGVPRSTPAARRLLEKAAEAGDHAAQESMGDIALVGRPVEDLAHYIFTQLRADDPDGYLDSLKQARPKAREWYTKAAKGGTLSAFKRMGDMLALIKQGSEQNLTEAMIWYSKASDRVAELKKSGDFTRAHRRVERELKCWMGLCIVNRSLLAEAKSDQRKGWKMIGVAAQMGSARAMAIIAYRHWHGRHGVPMNRTKGLKLLREAAAAGDPLAKKEVAMIENEMRKRDK